MTDAHTTGSATGTGDRSRPRAALPVLCDTQITSWGIVYYAFPFLNPRITADTGWSATSTTTAFSGVLLVSALTIVTLVGGLASTAFAPLTAALDEGI